MFENSRFPQFLSPERKKIIKSLPDQVLINLDNNKTILLCHSTPDNNHFIYLDPQYTDLMLKYLETLKFDDFWQGHTYIHYFAELKDKLVFNPRSLGDLRTNSDIITFGYYNSDLDSYSIYGLRFIDKNPLLITGDPFKIIL